MVNVMPLMALTSAIEDLDRLPNGRPTAHPDGPVPDD
jgi:hypothetical protein